MCEIGAGDESPFGELLMIAEGRQATLTPTLGPSGTRLLPMTAIEASLTEAADADWK